MTQDNLTPANTYTIVGIVAGIFPPATTANGKLRPAILELDSKKYGKCNFAFFQRWENGERTENLPEEWEEITKVQDWVMGKRIAITATFSDTYMDKPNFKNPTSIEYLDDEPPTTPTQKPTPMATPVATLPPQQWSNDPKSIQIAWNSAINNAVSRIPFQAVDHEGHFTAVIDWDYISLWMTQVDALAWSLFHLIRRGALDPMVHPQETAEQSLFDEPTDLGLSGQII